MVGCPARQVGWACACGETLPEPTDGHTKCGACGATYRQTDAGLAQTNAG